MTTHHVDEAETAAWAKALHQYRTPHNGRGAVELAITAMPFALLWWAMHVALQRGQVVLFLALLPVAAGFLVRLFLIQHDCGHQAFFAQRRANDWTGRLISVLTLTPYDHWRYAHAIHHASSGNLARRGVGDIDTLTVLEYQARTPWTRWRYRLYRHPMIMFGIGPFLVFVLQNRLPVGFMRAGWRPWASTMGTNLAIAAAALVPIHWIGAWAFLSVQAPIMLVSAAVGGWLFYVQHQFEATCWDDERDWNARHAALRGSSHYELPVVLRWFTANIGVHHVHHLSSRIPFYRLPDVLRDHPRLRGIGRITLLQSLRSISLRLWDEDSRRLISFRELRRRLAADVSARPVADSA